MTCSFALVVPLANEAKTFQSFIGKIQEVLNSLGAGKVYLVVDLVSKELCRSLSDKDKRFITVWAPENKNVVDAYLRGYQEAVKSDYTYILEMDGGLSHDPFAIPMFLRNLSEGHNCVFGSRFINGG